MITVKEAVRIARGYLIDLLSDSNKGGNINLLLEEAELQVEDQIEKWFITFSYAASYEESPVLQRYFKTVVVLAHTGEVTAVKIRTLH